MKNRKTGRKLVEENKKENIERKLLEHKENCIETLLSFREAHDYLHLRSVQFATMGVIYGISGGDEFRAGLLRPRLKTSCLR